MTAAAYLSTLTESANKDASLVGWLHLSAFVQVCWALILKPPSHMSRLASRQLDFATIHNYTGKASKNKKKRDAAKTLEHDDPLAALHKSALGSNFDHSSHPPQESGAVCCGGS
jgi:hypothetical protein